MTMELAAPGKKKARKQPWLLCEDGCHNSRSQAMRTSCCRFLAILAAQSLGLSLMGCSSSRPIKPAPDAAVDTGPIADAPLESTAAGGDAFLPDRAMAEEAPGADEPPSRDLVPVDTTAPKDVTAPGDLALPKDGAAGDLALPKDGPGADLFSSADLTLTDGGGRDGASPDQAARDGGADLATGCLADGGFPPACNDDPNSEAVMGTCQPDGTCKCNSGYVLNPSTGRCRYPPRDGSPGDTDALANLCTGAYDSCMCSCCGTIGRAMMCYYPTLGESVATLAAADQERWASAICGAGACSSGVHYLCCTPADPEPSSAATYTASGYVGGSDGLGIKKVGADCASLMFTSSGSAGEGFQVDAGALWTAEGASFGPCGDAGTRTYAQGALGTLTFRMADDVCVMDLHATLFAISDAAELTTARMDADGVPMPSLLGGYCP
jgi:hypothetical protein